MTDLRIKVFGQAYEDVCPLEKALPLLDFKTNMVTVDGRRVNDFEELVRLAGDPKYRDKEYIEVVQLPPVAGG